MNIGGTAAVLEAAREVGARRVVLASTAGVYGDPGVLPTPEHAPIAPLSPYGASKAAAETYMQLFTRLHGLSTLALRMANVYGPRQDPHGEAGVVAIFTGAAREGRSAIDLRRRRADARLRARVRRRARRSPPPAQSPVTGVLNVSTGPRDERRRAWRACSACETELRPGRAGEILRSCLDPTAAAQALGWRAQDVAGGRPGDDPVSFPQIPVFDLRLEEDDVQAVLDVYRSGWLTMGPRTAEFEARVRRAPRRQARRRRLLLHGGAAPRVPGRGRRAR